MIDAIQIKNFKCFYNQTIPLNQLAVFAGANGGGKSTAIQALLLVRQTIDRLKQYQITPIPIEKISERIKLNEAYHLNLGNSKDVTCAGMNSDMIELSLVTKNYAIAFKYLSSRIQPDLTIGLQIDREAFPPPLPPADVSPPSIYADSFHYLVAERVGPRDVQFIGDDDFITTGYSGEYTAYAMYRVADSKVDVERCIDGDTAGKSNLFKKQVEAWMDLIIPGIEILPELYDTINSARVGLRRTGSETDYLKPTNIGFGITYVLPVVVSGLIAPKNSMLIVENPEAHLHPLGQSRIGMFLAQIAGAGVQVILETHSEHVINGIRLAILKKLMHHDNTTINFFNQERKSPSPEIVSISMNETADLSVWPKGFLDQEELDLGEIFRLKKQKKHSQVSGKSIREK